MENQATFKKGLLTKKNISEKNSALNQNENNGDGILRIDLKKADKTGNYEIKGRLLPNLKKDGNLGENMVKRITHFVNLGTGSPLNGFYDCPRNFDPKALSPIGGIQYQLKNSQNAADRDKAKKITWQQKWFSYFLVYEDYQVADNNGKIFILSYGKQILNKITNESKGQNTLRKDCDVFDLATGKDMRLVVYEKETKNEETGKIDKYPDYTNTQFFDNPTPIKIFVTKEDSEGNIIRKEYQTSLDEDGEDLTEKDQMRVFNFLIARTCDMDIFEPKKWTDLEEQKVEKIVAILSGKESQNNSADATDLFENNNDSDDFFDDEDDEPKKESKKVAKDDDFDDFDDVVVDKKPKTTKADKTTSKKVETPATEEDDDLFPF